MKNDVLVSVGMPVCNGMPYIEPALKSLLRQSHSRLEIIISDDYSTDGTFECCDQLAKTDSRIRLFTHQTKLGMWDNFQFVLDSSRGDYFMWAAQDDVWDVDWIKGALGAHSDEHILSACSFCTIDGSNRRRHTFTDSAFSEVAVIRVLQVMYSHMTGLLMYGLFKRESIVRTGAFGPLKSFGLRADPLFIFRMALIGNFSRSSYAVMFKRLRVSNQRSNINPRRAWEIVREILEYSVSYFKLDMPMGVRIVLLLNLIPFVVHLLYRHWRSMTITAEWDD